MISHAMSILSISGCWLLLLRVGMRWCQRAGVLRPLDRLVLGTLLPQSILLVSMHLTGLLSMLDEPGWFQPLSVASFYAAATAALLVGSCKGGRRETRFLHKPTVPAAWSTATGQDVASTWDWLPVVLLFPLYGLMIAESLTRGPNSFDGLHYHLPVAISWMQCGDLHMIPGVAHQSLPGNGTLLYALAAFFRNESLFPLIHLPVTLYASLVTYCLARWLANRTAAIWATCIAMSIPVVAFQSVTSYIDVYAAAATLASLLAIVWSTKIEPNRRVWLWTLAGVGAGIAFGSKTTYLLIAILLAGTLLFAMCEGDLRRLRPRTASRALLLFAGGALLCSGFWLYRGWAETGNPLWPVSMQIGSVTLLRGMDLHGLFAHRPLQTKLLFWLSYPWHETKIGLPGYAYNVYNGLGLAFATFVPAGLLFAAPKLRKREPATSTQHLGDGQFVSWLPAVAIGWCAAGILLVATLFQEVLRFILPVPILAVVVAAPLLAEMRTRHRFLTTALLSAAILLTVGTSAFVPAHAMLSRARSESWTRADQYGSLPELDALPPGSRVAVMSRLIDTYPALGRRFTNIVLAPLPVRQIMGDGGFNLDRLRQAGVDYLLLRASDLSELMPGLGVILVADGRHAPRGSTTDPMLLFRVPAGDMLASPRGP